MTTPVPVDGHGPTSVAVGAEPSYPGAPRGLSVGDFIEDRYRIDAVLGEGGMGIVYRAEHLRLRKPHALKVLLPQWSAMPEVVARFQREAVAAGSINNPHVAAGTDFGRLPDGSFFLVMEFLDGRTLGRELESGRVPPKRALHVIRGVVEALEAAHALGIVHRDIKPENIMLVDRNGDADFVKVLDFGIARLSDPDTQGPGSTATPLTRVGAVMGTPDYMAPEQALGRTVDARTDLYAVGVVLFEMLCGECPFAGGPMEVIRQQIGSAPPPLPSIEGLDPRVASIVSRLLAKEPESRFQSASELLAALDECARQLPTPALPALAEAPPRYALAPLVEGIRTMAGPHVRGLVRRVPPRVRPWVAAGLGAALLLLAVSLTRGGDAPANTSPEPMAPAREPTVAAVPSAPPPPLAETMPSASPSADPSGQPASRAKGRPRRTGPGGIYVPPPRDWFK